jgi:acid stress chaperone HdeB
MISRAIALAFAGALVASSASAQTIDMNTVTCKDFTSLNKDVMFGVVMWLDAYYRDEDSKPIINFDKMGQKAGKLGAYCATNPTHSLTTAAEPIMEGD